MGPLWIDLSGYELDAEEKEILQHPTVGGVILFSRNFHDNEQLLALNNHIRKVTKNAVLIGVDQEGGLVQRFRQGFSLIPPAQSFAHHNEGEVLAEQAGWLMAAELIAHNIDLSFAPVLDKGHECKAIRSRSFGEDVQTVIRYSHAYIKGMKRIGMATTGKHFPGHGGVVADSHFETPMDKRRDLFESDMQIFKHLIDAGVLDAIMPAHVIYPNYDLQPASGSSYWLKTILRQRLGFKGVVFSDDLNMEGASVMGGAAQRAQQALNAGCDMLLLCNNRRRTVEVLDNLQCQPAHIRSTLFKKSHFTLSELRASSEWKQAREAMKSVLDSVDL